MRITLIQKHVLKNMSKNTAIVIHRIVKNYYNTIISDFLKHYFI